MLEVAGQVQQEPPSPTIEAVRGDNTTHATSAADQARLIRARTPPGGGR